LARCRAAWPGDAGDADADLRPQAYACAARERPGDDRRDGAVSVNEVGWDVRVDRFGRVGIDDRAAHEVVARSAVRGEARGEQTAGARFGGGDREPAPPQARLDRVHPPFELRE